MTPRSLLGHAVAVAMLMGVGACASWVTLTTLDNDLPTEFDGCKVLNQPVPPLGQAIVLCSVWRHRRCAVSAEQVIYDARDVRYVVDPYSLTRTGALGRRQVKYAFQVPEHAAPGPARYEASRSYVCALLQNLWPIEAPVMALDFTIGKPL